MLISQEQGAGVGSGVLLSHAFKDVAARPEDIASIESFLGPLRDRDPRTYGHSVRVGMFAKQIGKHLKLDERPLLFSGLLHDLGKSKLPPELLAKTEGWTATDSEQMESHVMEGYNMIKGKFDFTAEIVLLHHRFQEKGYPRELPPHLHLYSQHTQDLILEYARILSIADVYDALHRVNDKFGVKRALTSEEIRNKMLELNPDRKKLIEELYQENIFS